MEIHEHAENGYAKVANAYDRGRPGYPIEVANFLCSLQTNILDKTVLDLGAGTGKFTSLLSTIGAEKIIAIEPVESMRDKLFLIRDIAVMEGTAENIPLDDNSVDIVTCAQAFHWFDGPTALKEIRRVLKPNGLLFLVWNVRNDDKYPWLQQMAHIYERRMPSTASPRYKHMEWKKLFEIDNGFSALEHRQFSNDQCGTMDSQIDCMLSVSYIAVLPDEEHKIIADKIRVFLQNEPEIKEKSLFVIPYCTDVYWCTSLKKSESEHEQ
ncbi:unnamed protein product [Didymodactylos carnosus]|uniref:Methyltransferase type 11 domain-containing protein n=1 Tax=Didymodactylos carnosus TaxID=1234261 RepID=A0A815EBR3_9BILA|nr:unnamed protein product [Didymodactylos carnosus]CAF4151741.1 unnamed protein product [Didymodactylos carnosus]